MGIRKATLQLKVSCGGWWSFWATCWKKNSSKLERHNFDNISDEDDDYILNYDDLETFACTECDYECTEKKMFDEHIISHNTKSNPKRKKNDTANKKSNKK